MIKEPKYMVKFTQAYNDNGTVWYTIQVFNAKEEQSWVFKERYSKMRTIHENCQKTKWKNDLPQFPPRKLFNNTNQQFIQKRKKQLQNYYSTLFRTIQIQDLQQVFKFFNTNKPIKEKQKPVQKNKQQQQQAKPQKKQKQMKKIFQEIVNSSQKEMVESNEFNNDIQDQTRRKFNLEFQKLKLDLKSPLINTVLMPKGDKENDTDFWAIFVKDNHEDRLLKANEVGSKVSKYLKQTQNTKIRFVVPL